MPKIDISARIPERLDTLSVTHLKALEYGIGCTFFISYSRPVETLKPNISRYNKQTAHPKGFTIRYTTDITDNSITLLKTRKQ